MRSRDDRCLNNFDRCNHSMITNATRAYEARLSRGEAVGRTNDERWQTSVDDCEYFCLRSQYFASRTCFVLKCTSGGGKYIYIYIYIYKAVNQSGKRSRDTPAGGAGFAIFGGENFPWKSLTSPGSSTSSTRRTERLHTYTVHADTCPCAHAVRVCTRARTCVCNRVHNVGGLCLVYRGGSSRRERRATASHWPPIGRSGGGSLQSSIQAVIG